MKHLIVMASQDPYEHAGFATVAIYYEPRHSASDITYLAEETKAHFKKGTYSKVTLTSFDLDPETGVISNQEQFSQEHPKKQRLELNKAAREAILKRQKIPEGVRRGPKIIIDTLGGQF